MNGPYMNEDGDWWVAVEDASFREARKAIVMCLDYSIPEEGTLLYRGIMRTTLCDGEHQVGPECNEDCSRDVQAWHFEENRRW